MLGTLTSDYYDFGNTVLANGSVPNNNAPVVVSTPAYVGPDDYTLADMASDYLNPFTQFTSWFGDNPWAIALVGIGLVLVLGKRK